jgi:hypothetical protein
MLFQKESMRHRGHSSINLSTNRPPSSRNNNQKNIERYQNDLKVGETGNRNIFLSLVGFFGITFGLCQLFSRKMNNTFQTSALDSSGTPPDISSAVNLRRRHEKMQIRLMLEQTEETDDEDNDDEVENDEKDVEQPEISHKEKSIEKDSFIFPHLDPGNIHPFVWKSNRIQVDKYARLVGIPTRLTEEIRKFCVDIGLMDAFRSILYSNPVNIGRSRLLSELKGPHKWAVTRPSASASWINSDLHWVDATDEESFEYSLSILKRGDLSAIAHAIGTEFESESLAFLGMGFIIVSHSTNSQMHQDNPGGGKDFFDLLFPLTIPENDISQLYVGDNEKNRGLVTLEPNLGVLLGMDTWHATADCDYRKNQNFRVFVSIYIADVNEDNVGLLSEDGTALFPVPGQQSWLMAQQGRLWRIDEGVVIDQGRKPFSFNDNLENCSDLANEGRCETDLTFTRLQCLKSCNVYLDDEEYFSKFHILNDVASWE